MQFKVDPKFRDKIPPLSEDEFKKLEENILSDGEVLEPLVVWNNTIIDGHNRWAIIQKHDITNYTVKQMEFADEWAAIVWMCRNQLGRRNVSDIQKTVLIAEAKRAQEKTHGGNRGTNRDDQSGKFTARDQSGPLRGERTKSIIAKQFGVGQGTVQRADETLSGLDEAEKVSPGFKEAVLSGEIKAPKSAIAEIRNMTDEEKRNAVEKIWSGEATKPKRNQSGKRYNGGGTKEYRETRESIEEIAADMYDVDKPVEYTINDLVEEIRVNAEAYVKQLRRTLEIRSALLTNENKPIVIGAVEEHVLQKLRKVADLLK